jgi:O-methyltransferase
VLKEDVPGDLLEAGVWRGGACILMRGILKAYGDTERCVVMADSFAGLPPPNPEKFPADEGLSLHEFPQLAVSVEQVRANFERYGLLDEQVEFLPGWFRDTLPTLSGRRFAVLRLDGDLYESTWDALTHLYPLLSPRGLIIIDDYNDITACRQAVDDYRSAHAIIETLVAVDWLAVYWNRSGVPG